jgi:hypothetical protein
MQLGLRWLSIFVGVGIFLWLSVEDTHTLPVALLGSAAALCSVLLWVASQGGLRALGPSPALALILMGGLIGALGVLTTTVLMFAKTAWHSHITPDYPPLMMLAMLERAPAWALAGMCVGAAAAALWPLCDTRRELEPIHAQQERPSHDDRI